MTLFLAGKVLKPAAIHRRIGGHSSAQVEFTCWSYTNSTLLAWTALPTQRQDISASLDKVASELGKG